MKILVLGSDGQIGSRLVELLKTHKHDVVEFDIYSNISNDLRIPNILDELLDSVSFVYFLAFDVGGSIYLEKYQNTYEFISNNVKIMNSTFDSLKKFNKPFIFASSQMSNMIYSQYGVLKRIGEYYTKTLNGVVVKLWNVYGHEKDLNKSHVITDFILMAKNTNQINMRTDGSEKRQFLYVDDCCDCLIKLMNVYDELGSEKEFDISSFKWESVYDIARIISTNYNNCEIFKGTKDDNIQQDKQNIPNLNILRLWKPNTSLESGIIEIIKLMNDE